jgi:SAM-dependent methyltransferase
MSTLDYYNGNSREFDERTRHYDMRPRMQPFIDMLPAGARILDAGCGPGRDVQTFRELGFDAMGIDGSQAMVELARTIALCARVEHIAFHEIEFVNEFDGIWASASLLHVPSDQIDDAMHRLARALRVGAVIYMSVKEGDGRRVHDDGRVFYDYSTATLRELFARHPALELISIEHSPPSAGQSDRKSWLHALARKRVSVSTQQ